MFYEKEEEFFIDQINKDLKKINDLGYNDSEKINSLQRSIQENKLKLELLKNNIDIEKYKVNIAKQNNNNYIDFFNVKKLINYVENKISQNNKEILSINQDSQRYNNLKHENSLNRKVLLELKENLRNVYRRKDDDDNSIIKVVDGMKTFHAGGGYPNPTVIESNVMPGLKTEVDP